MWAVKWILTSPFLLNLLVGILLYGRVFSSSHLYIYINVPFFIIPNAFISIDFIIWCLNCSRFDQQEPYASFYVLLTWPIILLSISLICGINKTVPGSFCTFPAPGVSHFSWFLSVENGIKRPRYQGPVCLFLWGVLLSDLLSGDRHTYPLHLYLCIYHLSIHLLNHEFTLR